jgi:hypothetical protein
MSHSHRSSSSSKGSRPHHSHHSSHQYAPAKSRHSERSSGENRAPSPYQVTRGISQRVPGADKPVGSIAFAGAAVPAAGMSKTLLSKVDPSAWALAMVEKVKQSELFKFSQRLAKEEALAEEGMEGSERYYQKLEAQSDMSDMISTQFHRLGNVSLYDRHYFEESETSRKCAAEFLSGLFSNEPALSQIQNFLSMNDTPMTVSFIPAILQGNKCCFFALSVKKGSKGVRQAIERFTDAFSNSEYTFIMVNEGSTNYTGCQQSNDIEYIYKSLHASLKAPGWEESMMDKFRFCSEKAFYLPLLQLYACYGGELQVEGLVTCYLSPRPMGKQLKDDVLELSKGRSTRIIPPCKCCMRDKHITLLTFALAQDAGSRDQMFPVPLNKAENLARAEQRMLSTGQLFLAVLPDEISPPTISSSNESSPQTQGHAISSPPAAFASSSPMAFFGGVASAAASVAPAPGSLAAYTAAAAAAVSAAAMCNLTHPPLEAALRKAGGLPRAGS